MLFRLTTVLVAALPVFLFCYLAARQLMAYSVFATPLSRTPLTSWGAATLAWLVPLPGLVPVLLLLFPRTRRAGLYGPMIVLSVFALPFVAMLLTGLHLPSRCGSLTGAAQPEAHVVFQLVFPGLRLPAADANLLRNQGMPKTCNRVGNFLTLKFSL